MSILVVDSGTTTTRVWFATANGVEGPTSRRVGARDRLDRNSLLEIVRALADELLETGAASWADVEATVAFGMITSEFGVEEIPHLEGPIDANDLARSLVHRDLSPQLPGPVLLVPGVKWSDGDLAAVDFMRGEETEIVGLLASGTAPPFLYVSPGSHSKFIAVDGAGRIEWSLTTISGELLWALSQETILAGIVDPTSPRVDPAMVEQGVASVDSFGLSRSLYVARLLHRLRGLDPQSCSSFVIGAVAGGDLASLEGVVRTTARQLPAQVVVKAGTGLGQAYAHLAAPRDWVADVVSADALIGPRGAVRLFEMHDDSHSHNSEATAEPSTRRHE